MTRGEFVTSFQKKLFGQFPNGFQSWWPNFIFHFSDINNIVSALNSGVLYSRAKATELGLMHNDNANSDVIDNTSEKYKNFVRCYFGAKTPTQFVNEGIKPSSQIRNNAHCPVPVFLLFDFVKLLSRDDVLFSSGNIAASGADVYSIYDRQPLPQDSSKGHMLYCRHAEVLIPYELSIFDYLKFVCVRSEAEKETLLFGLNQEVKERLANKIKVFAKDGLFFNDRLFVNKVEIVDGGVDMHFANAGKNEFDMRIVASHNSNDFKYDRQKIWKIPSQAHWSIPELQNFDGLYMRIDVDGNKVYENILTTRIEEIF